MALEEALNRNSELLEKLVAQNEKILGIAASRQADKSADAGDTKATKETKSTKATKETKSTKADDDGADTKVTKAELGKALATWLNEEFGKAADGHPEAVARHGAFKTVLGKLGIEGGLKGLADDDQTNIDKLHNWLENTAKKADKGFGIGRLAADPEETKAEDGDDLGI